MPAHLFDAAPEETPIVLSYGMGVDSTALLLRWMRDRRSRDFSLDELTVLTAQTGDEFPDTKRLVEAHLLPLLREFHIRYVQIARTGPLQGDGLTILDDSREPTKLFIEGDFTLSQELRSNGTVPQVATGQRRCTHHFKGHPLTAWTDREFGDQPVRKVIGYNADEQARALRSEGYSTDARRTEYPLIEWGWGREKCEKYIKRVTGETWRKSACVFCPFSGGKPDVLGRYRQFPAEAAEALFLEHVARTFNPAMTLFSKKSLRSVLERDGNAEALRLFSERLEEAVWALYRVRRIVWAKGRADRKTERGPEGKRDAVIADLLRRGATDDDGIPRLYLRRREKKYPTIEEMLVASPVVVDEKGRPRFEENWAKLTGPTLFR